MIKSGGLKVNWNVLPRIGVQTEVRPETYRRKPAQAYFKTAIDLDESILDYSRAPINLRRAVHEMHCQCSAGTQETKLQGYHKQADLQH